MVNRADLFKPTSNTSEPIWVSTPVRTTADLVSSCLLTLFLCTWTAVHLNIPGALERQSKIGFMWRAVYRCQWMLIALLAPEVVLFSAYKQYAAARGIAIALNRFQDIQNGFETRYFDIFKESLSWGNPRDQDNPDSTMNAEIQIEARTKTQSKPMASTEQTIPFTETPLDFEGWKELGTVEERHTRRMHQLKWILGRHPGLYIEQQCLKWGNRKNKPWEVIEWAASAIRRFFSINSTTCLGHKFTAIKTNLSSRLNDWFPPGLEKGFFIVMGGYEVFRAKIELRRIDFWEITSAYGIAFTTIYQDRKAYLEKGNYTITPQGALTLARFRKLPQITVAEIHDKSKADVLAKILVCLQASWMIIQCIARKAQGLPVTLLEINTLMHVVCALLMYILWFGKPQEVSQPVVVDRDDPISGLLLNYCNSTEYYMPHQIDEAWDGIGENLLYTENGDFYLFLKGQFRGTLHPPDTAAKIDLHNLTVTQMEYFQKGQLRIWIRGSNQAVISLHRWPQNAVSYANKAHWMFDPNPYLDPSLDNIRGLCTYISNLPEMDLPILDNDEGYILHRPIYKANTDWNTKGFSPNFGTGNSFSDMLDVFADVSTSLIPIAVTAAYGGIHLLPWDGHFPTHFERLLWRVSGCFIALSGFWLLIMTKIEDVIKDIADTDFPILVWLLIQMIFYLSYILARVYLVAEAFASLRSLPLGAYTTVSWVELIPHL